jgi:ATP-binding cassette subfamily B protein
VIGDDPQEDEILGKAYDARLMVRVLRYLRPYWKLLAVAFTFLLLQTGTQLLGPYITKIAIDRYIATQDVDGLDRMALAYLGVVIFGFIVLFVQTYTTSYIGQRAMHDLRMEIFSHLQRQDLAYFDRNAVGRLMTRTINDVETLNELFSTGVVGLMGDLSIVFGIAFMMFWLDWQLALVCLAAFPVILYISRFYRRRAREVYRESRMILGRLNAGLQENIAGVATVQAFGQEEKMYRRFQDVNLSYRNVLLQSIRYNALFFPVIEVFSAISIGLLLWHGAHQILASAVQAGVLVAFIQYIQRMYQPIAIWQRSITSCRPPWLLRSASLPCSTSRRRLPIRPNPSAWKEFAGEVEFQNVRLSYRPGEPVLKGISFRVRPGEKVAWWVPPAAARRRSSPRSAVSTTSRPARS